VAQEFFEHIFKLHVRDANFHEILLSQAMAGTFFAYKVLDLILAQPIVHKWMDKHIGGQ
jgi:hypothetical protein